MDVEVLAVSTDSRFTHKIWQEQELTKMVEGGVPFPMLSDAGGRIGKIYGVYEEMAGVNVRGRFIIDPDQVIQAMEILTPAVGRNVAELIRQVKAFQHVRATGEATLPAGSPAKRPSNRGRALWGTSGKSGNRTWPLIQNNLSGSPGWAALSPALHETR